MDEHIITLGFIGMPGHWELLVVLVLGLLLFGRRLPEVGRSLGKGIVEFKRGLKSIEDDIEEESSKPSKPLPPDNPMQSRQQTTDQGLDQNGDAGDGRAPTT